MKLLRAILELVVAMFLGAIAILTPVLLNSDIYYRPAVFLPFMGAAEKMNWLSFLLLFVVGVALGRLATAPFWLLGLATMWLFPVWSYLDLKAGDAVGLDNHNLAPIEWAAYVLVSLIGVAGASVGVAWKQRAERRV
jgi:hypothetical protein